MRKYLQLIIVLAIFFSAVYLRHLREPARLPPPENGVISAGSSSTASRPASALPTASPGSSPTSPLPSLTGAAALVVALGPVTPGPTAEATPYPAVADRAPVAAP